jgi:hypothetical protein
MNDDRAYRGYLKEINKDMSDVERHKKLYIKEVRESLGAEINDFNSYIKKEPSVFAKFKGFIARIFRHL